MTGGWELLAELHPALDTARLDRYVEELLRWNKAIRLVGPKDASGVRRQVVDALLPYLHCESGFPLLDIGSGAGLPAIPLAVAWPGERIVALEPLAKRVSFLRHVARTLALDGLEVVQGRAGQTDESHPAFAGGFRCVTARAVSDIASLLGWARPYLAPGGSVVLGRGDEPVEQVAGWRIARQKKYVGPTGVGPRRVMVYSLEAP